MFSFIYYLYAILGLFFGFSLYGFKFLFLMPIWFIYKFTGIPNIINSLRVKNYQSPKEHLMVLLANIISASILFMILEFTFFKYMKGYFFFDGILFAFSLPKAALIDELQKQKKK